MSYLLGRLVQHFVHIKGHGVVLAEILEGRLGGLGVRVQGGLVLLQELLLNSYIVVCYAQNRQTVFWFFDLLTFRLLCYDFCHQLVLDQDQRFHGMLECELMLAHLAENRADVEVDVGGVEHLEAIIDALLAKVQIVVLNLESLFKVSKSRPQLLCPSENASEVVVGNRSVLVTFVSQGLCFAQELKCYVKAFYGHRSLNYRELTFLQKAHAQNVANDGGLLARFHNSLSLVTVQVLLHGDQLVELLQSLQVFSL